MKIERPRSVTVLAFLVLTKGSINLIRVIESIRQWTFLRDIMTISPVYLTITGLLWAITGFVLLWGLIRGEWWAPKTLRITSVVYIAYIWLDRFLLINPSSRPPNNLFMVIVSFLFLGYVFWTISRKNVKAFFGENYE